MTTRIIGLLCIVLGAGAAAFLLPSGQPPPGAAPPPAPPAVDGVVPHRGLAIQVHSGYQPLATFEPLLKEVAALGANTVLLSAPGFMEHARSQSIYIDARKVPAPDDFQELIRRANRLGLRVFLMPIVLLRNPRGNEWRGQIEPPDWEDWWAQYSEFVLYFADIAREGGAAGLLVGSELISTERMTDRWTRLIAAVRPRFYGGRLGYSANWDHFRPIEFWDKLDFIGLTSYFTLADRRNPTVEEIVARWEPIRRDVLAWQRRIGKPILFTEVGWCSQEGAATAPWNYYQNQVATPAGHEEQRRLYEAFVQVWGATPELLGVIWWEWTPGPGGPDDYGYSPRNKPAEQVLRRWFAASRPATAPASQPAPAP